MFLSNIENSLIHKNIVPLDVRKSDGITADIKFNLESRAVQIWAISPLGGEFICNDNLNLSIGDAIEMILNIRNQKLRFSALLICLQKKEKGNLILGVRWLGEQGERIKVNRNSRWICSDIYPATLVCSNPIQFEDLLLFKVKNIGEQGVMLTTSLRNKFLIQGMYLEGTFSFPMIGSAAGKLEIKWAKVVIDGEKERLALGIELMQSNKMLNQAMADYVLQFGDEVTISQLKKSGLRSKKTQNILTFSYSKTKKEHNDLISLRKLCYEFYSKSEITELTDHFDTKARILIARHNGKAIGTLRIIFHSPSDRLEQEQYIKLPKDFPQNHELVEVTRICVHPDYQASTVMMQLLKHCFVVMLQTNRRYLVGSSPDHLKSTYKALGAKITDLQYSPNSCRDLRLNVLITDLHDLLKGKDIHPLYWCRLYDSVSEFSEKNNLVRLNNVAKVRLWIFRLINKAYKLVKKTGEIKKNK